MDLLSTLIDYVDYGNKVEGHSFKVLSLFASG